jgi:hypothetical protein
LVAILEQVFREQWGRVLAALIGFLGEVDLAEDAAQEAFAIAAERWPRVSAMPIKTARHDGVEIAYETFPAVTPLLSGGDPTDVPAGDPLLLITGIGMHMLCWPDGFAPPWSTAALRSPASTTATSGCPPTSPTQAHPTCCWYCLAAVPACPISWRTWPTTP